MREMEDMSDQSKCELCGEPMPPGEDMFNFHGYSGPCPKPPLPLNTGFTGEIPNRRNFNDELTCLLNKYSKENGSNTPDFILADYLTKCLETWNHIIAEREDWYGRKFYPGRIDSSGGVDCHVSRPPEQKERDR